MTEKEFLISVLTTGFKVVIPWKMSCGKAPEYCQGWNDCIKECKKQRSNFMKMIKSTPETK